MGNAYYYSQRAKQSQQVTEAKRRIEAGEDIEKIKKLYPSSIGGRISQAVASPKTYGSSSVIYTKNPVSGKIQESSPSFKGGGGKVIVGPSSKGSSARGKAPGVYDVGGTKIAYYPIPKVTAPSSRTLTPSGSSIVELGTRGISKPQGSFDIRDQMLKDTYFGNVIKTKGRQIATERQAFALPWRRQEIMTAGILEQAEKGRQQRWEASPTGRLVAAWDKGEEFASKKVKGANIMGVKLFPEVSSNIQQGIKYQPLNPMGGFFQRGKVALGGGLVGAYEGVRDKPLKTAATMAIFGSLRLAGGLVGTAGKVVSKTPAGKKIVSGISTSFEIIRPAGLGLLGGLFAKDVEKRVREVPGGIYEKSKKSGEIFSTEILPAGIGYTLAGKRLLGSLPTKVKARVKKYKFDRKIRKFEKSITEKGKDFVIPQREVFVASGEVAAGRFGGALETLRLRSPKGIAAESLNPKAPLESQLFLGKAREVQTQLRPKKVDLLPGEIQSVERTLIGPTIEGIRARGAVKVTRTFKSDFDPLPTRIRGLMQRRSQPKIDTGIQQNLVRDVGFPKDIVGLKSIKLKDIKISEGKVSTGSPFELPKKSSSSSSLLGDSSLKLETVLEQKSYAKSRTFFEKPTTYISKSRGKTKVKVGGKSKGKGKVKEAPFLERTALRKKITSFSMGQLGLLGVDATAYKRPTTRIIQPIKQKFSFIPIRKPITDQPTKIGLIPGLDLWRITPTDKPPLVSIPRIGWGYTPPPTPPPPPPTGFPLLPFFFGTGKPSSSYRRTKSRTKFKSKYTPSFVATYFNIKGKRPGLISGLEIRPILGR